MRNILQRGAAATEEDAHEQSPHALMLPHQTIFAVIEIGVADRARLIGQPFFAASANSPHFSAVAPGTLPWTSRWISTMVQPMSFFSMLTVASVLSSVGSRLAFVSWNASAIVKQLACAAAISSSGLVPARPSSDV